MKSRELKKMLPQLLMTALIGISSWLFTSIQDIKEHQGRCDAEVMNLKDNLDEVDEELDMLESNFNQLMFKLQG